MTYTKILVHFTQREVAMSNFLSMIFSVFVICLCFGAIGADLDCARQFRADADEYMFGKRTFEERTIVQGLLTHNSVMQETRTFERCVSPRTIYKLYRVYKTQRIHFSENAYIEFRVHPVQGTPGNFMQLSSRCRGSSCQMMSEGILEIRPNKSACMKIVRGYVNPYHTFSN
jgi:hypothetical protein